MDKLVLGSRYYFSRLSAEEQKIYRAMYDCWFEGGCVARIQLPGRGFSLKNGRDLHEMSQFIVKDNPHLFQLEFSMFHYSRHRDVVTISTQEIYSKKEYDQVYQELVKKVSSIVTECNQKCKSDYEKIKFLHDYLVKNVTYEFGKEDLKSKREVHTVIGALLNGACVCDGYSRAFRLLCDQVHISCIVTSGESTQKDNMGHHAWNFVKLNGNVYHTDVTWDSNAFEHGQIITDYYFLRNDAIFSKDHSWSKDLYHPVINDYPREYFVSNSKQELEKFLCAKLKVKEKKFIVGVSEDFPGFDRLKEIMKEIEKRNCVIFNSVCYTYSYYDRIKIISYKFTYN